MQTLTLWALGVLCMPWRGQTSIGKDGDPSTCPLLAQNLRMMGEAAGGEQTGLNFTVGVPLRLTGIAGLARSRQRTVDISGTWNPANWQRDGRQGYERNNSAEDVALFRRELQCSTVYLSFNKKRGWWMLHPTFDLGNDGTAGWAIVDAPQADFPHQIREGTPWKVITERGVQEKFVKHYAEPTPDFFLSLSAIIDKDGDEVLEASEAAGFSFGGVRTASLAVGQDWIAQADGNNDGVLTMREVADGHRDLSRHELTKRWLENTAVIEATLRLLQRETARVRDSLSASTQSDHEEGGCTTFDERPAESDSSPAMISADEANSSGTEEHSGWLPFRLDSKCPIATSGNSAFEWGKAVLQQYMPKMLTS